MATHTTHGRRAGRSRDRHELTRLIDALELMMQTKNALHGLAPRQCDYESRTAFNAACIRYGKWLQQFEVIHGSIADYANSYVGAAE